MKRITRYMLLITLISTLYVIPAWAFDLTVLHINDSHSYLDGTSVALQPDGVQTYVELGGWTRLKTILDARRAHSQNVALLHAGDAVQGGLYFMKFHGKPEMELLDRFGFDAMVLGNHEFDNGPDFLAGLLRKTHIPILAANVDATGKPALAAQLKPYTILTYGDEKVGVIGLVLEDLPLVSSPGQDVHFKNVAETARMYVQELESQGINKIILLTHIGYDADKALAAEVSGIDVIVGGHSHTLLGDAETLAALGTPSAGPYPTMINGPDGRPVYVVTAWKWSRVFGSLDLTFDDSGHVTSAKASAPLILADDFMRKNAQKEKVVLTGTGKKALLASLAQNPSVKVVQDDAQTVAYLTPLRKGLDDMYSMVIGEAAVDLPHVRTPSTAAPHGSVLAPIVCDSMLWKIHTTGEKVDLVLLNAGAVRDGIEQGPISIGTVDSLLPFNNTLMILNIPGKDLVAAMEIGVARGSGAFPYGLKIRYSVDPGKPAGARLSDIAVQAADGTWSPLDPARIYSVAMNSYLANGGDGYTPLKAVSNRYDTGFGDLQVFIEYVRKMKVLHPLDTDGVTLLIP